jgi:hypothetical protein
MNKKKFEKFAEIFSKYLRKEENKKEAKEEIEKTTAETIGIIEGSIFTQYTVGGAFNLNLIFNTKGIAEASKEKRKEN